MAYGVKIKLSVDESVSGKQLRSQIQKAVNTATTAAPITLKHFSIELSQQDRAQMISRLQNSLSEADLTIKIKRIDASEAVKTLRSQLTTMLSGLSITGLREFLGTDGIEETYNKAAKAAEKLAEAQQNIKDKGIKQSSSTQEIKVLQSYLNSAVTQSKKIRDDSKVAELAKQYQALSAEIGRVKKMEGDERQAAIDSLTEQVLAVKKVTAAQVEKETAAKKAADAAKRATAQELNTAGRKAETNKKKVENIDDEDTRADLAERYRNIQNQIERLKEVESARTEEAVRGVKATVQALEEETLTRLRNERTAKQTATEAIREEKEKQALVRKTISLRQNVEKWTTQNPRAYTKNKTEIDNMLASLRDTGNMTDQALSQVRTRFAEINESAQKSGTAGLTMFQKLQAGWIKFGNWSVITKSMTTAISVIKKMVSAVKELDAAMTELRKVTDLTQQGYGNFATSAAQTAKRIGATVADTINATADFARLGYDLDDAAMLAEAALIYKNVGDGIDDVSVATESLISTIKAFGYEASGAMSIVDMFNEVGNNFAISSSGIGDALQRSAAALAEAGNSLEESIGLVTAMNSVVQDPDSVGVALKTLTMYLRAAKTDAEAAGVETEGMATSVASLRDKIRGLTGVDIMIDANTFKSTYQIIKEISLIWDQLTDTSRSNVLNLLGGKRNANVISSLIQNFDDAEAAMSDAKNSFGSATAENEKYLDSINGKIAEMKASFEGMSQAALDSDIVKMFVGIGTAALNAATALAKINQLLPAVIMSMAIANELALKYERSKQSANVFRSFSDAVAGNEDGTAAIRQLTIVTETLTKKQKQNLQSTLQSSAAYRFLSDEEKKAVDELLKVSKASEVTEKGFKGLIARTKNLGGSIKDFWDGLSVFSRISAIVSIATISIGGIKAVGDKILANKQAMIDAAGEIVSAYDDAKKSAENNISSLEQLRSRYESLKIGVDGNGKNIDLTTSAYEEYKSIVDQIIQISPDLVKGYNAEGEAIVEYSTLLDDAIATQKEYLENQRQIYLGGGEDLFKGLKESYEQGGKEIREAGEDIYNIIYQTDVQLIKNSARSRKTRGTSGDVFSLKEEFLGDRFDTWQEALKEIGVDGENVGSYNKKAEEMVAELETIYEKRNELVTLLRASGEFSDSEINNIRLALSGLATSYTHLNDIQPQAIDYIMNWIQDESWYSNLPTQVLDEFRNGLKALVDPTVSLNENIKTATQYGEEFNHVYSTDATQHIVDMAQGVKDGTVSLAQYEEAVGKLFEDGHGGKEVQQGLTAYLMGLVKQSNAVSSAAERASTSTMGLTKAVERLKKGYDIMDTAQSEMALGKGLSIGTIDSIIGELGESEDISDYIRTENGLLLLNKEAWKKRTEAISRSDIEAMKTQKAHLEEMIKLRDLAAQYGNEEMPTGRQSAMSEAAREAQVILTNYGTDLNTLDAQLANTIAQIEIYTAALGKAEGEDPFKLKETFSGLSTTASEAETLVETLKGLSDGTALTQKELYNLAASYPKLLTNEAFLTAESAEEQKTILEELLTAYEETYDGIIDAQIERYTQAKANAEANGEDILAIQAVIDNLTTLKELTLTDLYGTEQSKSAKEQYAELEKSLEGVGSTVKITQDAYQEMIDADARYAGAIEYQNGVMVVNAEKHAEITNQILEEAKATALAEKQAILASKEYQDLSAAFKEGMLGEGDLQRLLDLETHIKGFDILTNEIDNATSAYARWLNRDGDDGKDRYSQALDAFEMIDDTLNNKESEYYGRIGRDEFGLAVDFVIGENVEVDTPEFKRGLELAKRYLTEGAEGATNFYDDLVKKGLIDSTTGALDTTIDEMAASLGISEDMVRTMIDRLNEYQTEANKITVSEPATAEVQTEETQAELEAVIKSLEDAQGYIANINSMPLAIEINELDKTMGDTMSINEALEALKSAIAAIEEAPLSIETGELEEATSQVTEYIRQIRGEIGEDGTISGSAEGIREALNGITQSVGSLTTKINTINSRKVDIGTGKSTSRLGDVSSQLSGIINKLHALKMSGAVTIRVNEVTTRTSINRTGGTAYASGTAQTSGGRTLVGELGMETVVDPNANKWYTVGERGAEFVKLPEGAIVFNHRQTAELFGAGQTPTRGDALASGNAAAKLKSVIAMDPVAGAPSRPGKYVAGTSSSNKATSKKTSSSTSKSSSSSSSSLEKLKEQYQKLNDQIEHLIEHQEFLFTQAERGYNFKGMQAALEEQARLYKQRMENAQAAVRAMQKKGADCTKEELQEMEKLYWEASDGLQEALDQLSSLYVDGLNEKIDGIQQAYESLNAAAEELSSSGGISIDTFQELIENGAQYLSLLENVDGQYVINRDGIEKMIALEKEQLAIESALSYIGQIKQALTNGDTDALAKMVNLTGQISQNSWDAVYAQAAMLKAAGLTQEQYSQVVKNIDALRAIAGSVSSSLTESTAKDTSAAYDEQRDALESILDLTEELIKHETDERIDAINEQIDAYQKIIDLKKESLKVSKDEDDYNKSLAEKTREIAKIQSQIDQLSLDDSREARAQRAALIEEMAELQSELSDYQSDHAYDAQIDALDKMAESYKESREGEIDELEKSVSSAEKVYQQAIQRLNTQWDTLYEELILWNTEAGSTLNSEITENWQKATEAVKQYGSYAAAAAKLKAAESETDSDKEVSSVVASGTPTDTTPSTPEASVPQPEQPSVEKEVKVTRGKWWIRTGAGTSHDKLGVAHTGEAFEYAGETQGTWYKILYKGREAWVSSNGSELIDKIPKYHNGGQVGAGNSLKNEEVLAVLKEDETVLTERQTSGLYRIIDFQKTLSEKLGKAIGQIGVPRTTIQGALAGMPGITGEAGVGQQINFSPTINIQIGHSDEASHADAARWGEIIADTTLDRLRDAFTRRGINTPGGRLKQ